MEGKVKTPPLRIPEEEILYASEPPKNCNFLMLKIEMLPNKVKYPLGMKGSCGK